MQENVVVHVMDIMLKEHKELDKETTVIEVKTFYNSCNAIIEIKGDEEDANIASLIARLKKEVALQVTKLNKDSDLSKKVSGKLEDKCLEVAYDEK